MVETRKRKLCALCGYSPQDDLESCPEDGTTLKVAEDDALIGQILSDRYRIESLLGVGGMGAVYKATHVILNRPVALKVLRTHLGDNEQERIRRFSQEARVISSLNHPNIVGATDFGVDRGRLFLVMDYVDGECLLDVLLREGRLEQARAVNLFVQISEALAYAHSRGIIHRDIKPSNVMICLDSTGKETVKLLDFGVAKIVHPGSMAAIAPVTRTGVVFGSPPYMSPEQCTGNSPDVRSDVYSLGCVMYEVLSGRVPIDGENSLEILHKQVIATPLEFHELRPSIQIAAGLEAIVFKALDKNIDARYQSMDELIADLLHFQDDHQFIPAGKLNQQVATVSQERAPLLTALVLILLVATIFAFHAPRSFVRRAVHPLPTSPVESQHIPAVRSARDTTIKTRDHHTSPEEKALSKAVVDLTRILEKTGKGKQAQAELKKLLNEDKNSLPPNDPALEELRQMEKDLGRKHKTNKRKHTH